MRKLFLLGSAVAALTAFQSPPGPDGQPRPSPTPTLAPAPTPTPTPSPGPSPSPSATPSGAPTPPVSDQSPEAKNSGDSGEVQGDDQPPKGRSRHHLRT